MVDATDLKSVAPKGASRFKSGRGHQPSLRSLSSGRAFRPDPGAATALATPFNKKQRKRSRPWGLLFRLGLPGLPRNSFFSPGMAPSAVGVAATPGIGFQKT